MAFGLRVAVALGLLVGVAVAASTAVCKSAAVVGKLFAPNKQTKIKDAKTIEVLRVRVFIVPLRLEK